MKKFLLYMFVLMTLVACGPRQNHTTDPNPPVDITAMTSITIEGCEYWQYRQHYYYAIEHKGNCKNPIHCFNQDHE